MTARRDSPGPTVEGLSEAKRRLIEQRLSGRPAVSAPEPTIPKRSTEREVPLSPFQRGIWLLQQVSPASAAYNLNSAFEVEGSLDLGLLQRSLNRLGEVQPILRSSFVSSGSGDPRVVVAYDELPVERLKVGAGEAVARARELARRPFKIGEEPLVRLVWIDSGSKGSILLLTAHHLILDEWSLGLFWRQLAEVYWAGSEERNATISVPIVDYSDYATWRSRRLEEGLEQPQMDFWRQRLEDCPAPVELPSRGRSSTDPPSTLT